MPRQPRNELPDGTFHVTAHGVFDLPLFADDADRRTFLWLLGEVTTRFRVRVLAYCLMGTHYHLLVESHAADLGEAMQRLNGRYARRYNERHLRTGHVFGQRYSAWVIQNDDHLEQTYAYIEANPAKAGLCDNGEPWPWTWIESRAAGADGRGELQFPATRVLPRDRPQGQA